MSAAIQIQGLYKIFGKNPQSALKKVQQGVSKSELLEEHNHILGLNNINLDIPAHQISVIMGLSGSGKSTLIRHINRLIEPTTGTITVFGEEVTTLSHKELREFRKYKTSMVFQKFGLHVHKTVEENIAYGLIITGKKKKDAIKESAFWLERVGLCGFEKNYPSALSGGMQQRVGLARALATNSDILLMDEAFSALDPLIRHDMQNILLDLQEELNKTIVFITHDLDEALKIGNTISILRDGEIIQTGAPEEIILNPADEYIGDFIKDINKGAVIKVSSIMQPCDDTINDGYTLGADTILEEALEQLVHAQSNTARITNKDGEYIGMVTLQHIVSVISKTKTEITQTYS